jgi:hypothetical protein
MLPEFQTQLTMCSLKTMAPRASRNPTRLNISARSFTGPAAPDRTGLAGGSEKRTFPVVDRPHGIKTAPPGVDAKTKADIPRIGLTMFLAIAAVLVILWVLGFIVFHVAGALIHLLIVLAVISLIVHFVMGRKTAGA